MEVNIRWNVTDLATIDGDLVSQHAGCRDLNRIWPIVIIVAEGISKVQNGILGDQGRVLCNIEMGGFNSTLSN